MVTIFCPGGDQGQRISIFVTGKSGTGKSTLIYGLLGLSEEEMKNKQTEVKDEASRLVTTNKFEANGVPVTLLMWRSPEHEQLSLDDYTMAQIESADFVLITMKMDDTRRRPGDTIVIRKLTRNFKDNFWEKTVFALTYANRVDFVDKSGMLKRTKKHLDKRKQQWTNGIHDILMEESVTKTVIDNIPIVPAGYYKEPKLYNEPWVDTLVSEILSRVTEEARPAVRKAMNSMQPRNNNMNMM